MRHTKMNGSFITDARHRAEGEGRRGRDGVSEDWQGSQGAGRCKEESSLNPSRKQAMHQDPSDLLSAENRQVSPSSQTWGH